MSIEASREDDPAGPATSDVARAGERSAQLNAAGADGAYALRTMNLTLGFGEKSILSDISTDIQRGAITALIGPTGSGKTTLLRTFNRMNDKVSTYGHEGDVLIDGKSIWH